MPALSAGLLLHRVNNSGEREVLLVHPGGPLWARKDAGAWSIPKGEYDDGAEPEAAARREFAEELGLAVPAGEAVALGSVTQPSRKVVTAFALAADLDLAGFRSNTFEMQWPPKSGRRQHFPEVDRAAWLTLDLARVKLLPGQVPFLDTLLALEGCDR